MIKTRIQIFKRILKSAFGLFVFSIGDYLTIIANIGLTPWDSLSMALANKTSISYGRICIVISLTIIIIDLILKEKIGVGTVLDAVLIGTFIDLFISIFGFSYVDNIYVSLLLLTVGLFIMAIGQVYYMSSGLSCGPRDSLLVAIGKRLPKLDIGYVDIIIKVIIIIVSYFMNGPIGIGTIYSMVVMGLAMKIIFKLFKFEPRYIKHENIVTTLQKLIIG